MARKDWTNRESAGVGLVVTALSLVLGLQGATAAEYAFSAVLFVAGLTLLILGVVWPHPKIEKGLKVSHRPFLTGNKELPYGLKVTVYTKQLIRTGIRITCTGNIFKVEAEKRRGVGVDQTVEDPVSMHDSSPNSFIFLVYNFADYENRSDLWLEARLFSSEKLDLVAVEQVKPGEAAELPPSPRSRDRRGSPAG